MRTWHKRREYGRLAATASRRPHETVGATTAVPVLDAPFDDLTAFDLVAALGNTTDAARLLGISQSAVSRRYRQFASHYRIVPSEKVGRYCLTSLHSPLAELRAAARRFRLLHGPLRLHAAGSTPLLPPQHNHLALVLQAMLTPPQLATALEHGLIDAHIDTPANLASLCAALAWPEQQASAILPLAIGSPDEPLAALLCAPIQASDDLRQLAGQALNLISISLLLGPGI